MFKGARPFSNDCCDIFDRYDSAQAHYVLRRRQSCLSHAKLFTDAPLDGIAQHGCTRIFFTDHETKARTRRSVDRTGFSAAINPNEAPTMGARFQRANEIVRLEQSGCSRKSRSG